VLTLCAVVQEYILLFQFGFKVLDAFQCRKVLSSVVIANNPEASGVLVIRVNINSESFKVLLLNISMFMVLQQVLKHRTVWVFNHGAVWCLREEVLDDVLDLADIFVLFIVQLDPVILLGSSGLLLLILGELRAALDA